MKFVNKTLRKLAHIPGFHTNRKIIIITSDDWGGVRVKSKKSRQNLINAGFDMDSNRFDKYDTLESNDDMEALFEVLLSYKDYKGNHPVITAVTNVGNPDFRKIRENDYQEYHYEPFTKTLESYPDHDRVYDLYKKGIELNIFKPELHGREHLQVNWWMQNLQTGNEIVKKAFDQDYWYLSGKYLANPFHRGLSAAFDIANVPEVELQKKKLLDAARIFRSLFDYTSIYFTPPAQHYNNILERVMPQAGIKLIDVPRLRKMPLGNGHFKTRLHYLGQRNKLGQRYLTRNSVFEPNLLETNDDIDARLAKINIAFKFWQPAIISNHRVAFAGGIDTKNRDAGLKALSHLFKNIIKKWPDVEFMSIADLYSLMNSK